MRLHRCRSLLCGWARHPVYELRTPSERFPSLRTRAQSGEETAHRGCWPLGKAIRFESSIRERMTGQAPRDDLTTLLGRWRTGTPDDRDRLFAAVHGELRRTAGAYMRRERRDHTLQPT